jgi:Arc/MetJ-type ribon-helix-helix transcriptional regulator
MKIRVSATIDEETEKVLNKIMEKGEYRNKSHVIEKAINLLLEKIKEQEKNGK